MTRVERWSRTLRDSWLPIEERAAAAHALAATATDDAVAVLADVLAGSTGAVRARIAESLGLAEHPHARQMLRALVEDPAAEVACAAVDGLAWSGGDRAATELMDVLGDGRRRLRVRCEAARALTRVGGRVTAEALARTISATPHAELGAAALAALVSRPVREIGDLFAWLLGQTAGPRRLRVLEALGDAAGDVAGIAAPYLADGSAEVREATALAMAEARHPGDVGDPLVAALVMESEPEVRFAIYHALANQVRFDVDPVVSRAVAEEAPELRLAAFAAVAIEVGRRPDAGNPFDRAIVPALVGFALDDTRPRDALAAVAILRTGMTAVARRALRILAASAGPVAVAAHAVLAGDAER